MKTSSTVTSDDGAVIAFTRIGSGPPLILVDGALCTRAMGPNEALAALLAERFTVYTYDRRGRGESSDVAPYAVEREVEDLAALTAEAGGRAGLYGISSGAVLALEAAARGAPVDRVALYEPPLIVDGTRPPVPADYLARLNSALAAGQHGKAVTMFMREAVRVPAPFVLMMRLMPAWPKLKAVAHTLPCDAAVLGDVVSCKPLPRDRWAGATMPVLVINGGKSPAWIRAGARALADVLPGAQHRTLPGQTHMVKPQALAPALIEFFSATAVSHEIENSHASA